MTRRDWRLIIAAFAILSVLWCIGGFIAAEQYHRTSDNTDRIAADQRRLQRLTIGVTASLCLQAFAPEQPLAAEPGATPRERATEIDLVRAFVHGDQIPLNQFGPDCPRAVAIARRQAEGK